ncbi:MAG: ribose-phosphate pyrophosphokinase [Chloroflexota bacterium]|nr:ribose-phosphate pyrophosphokinase [Chloroflexota bacterium]
MPYLDEMKVFSGNSHTALAEDVCAYLEMPLGQVRVSKFSNDNTFVQYEENIRQQDIFIIQPFAYPVNDTIMELLIMIDAAKRASAGRITAVVPYYAYGRTDKKDQPRVPITARLLADLLTVAGANRVVTVDLHAGQIQGFFNIPVDELTALPLLTDYFRRKELDAPVVVAVDTGISKRARDMATNLGVPLAIIEKRRVDNNDHTEILNVIGDVRNRTAITFDDETDTAGSLTSAVRVCLENGAREVYSCSTHGVFTSPAMDRIGASDMREIVVTDTLPSAAASTTCGKVTVLSVASLLGEAMSRIHEGRSVGELFTDV